MLNAIVISVKTYVFTVVCNFIYLLKTLLFGLQIGVFTGNARWSTRAGPSAAQKAINVICRTVCRVVVISKGLDPDGWKGGGCNLWQSYSHTACAILTYVSGRVAHIFDAVFVIPCNTDVPLRYPNVMHILWMRRYVIVRFVFYTYICNPHSHCGTWLCCVFISHSRIHIRQLSELSVMC